MKLKKLLSALLVCAMVLGSMSVVAFANENFVKVGENFYSTIQEALDNAADGAVIEILADEISMPDKTVISKPLSFKGKGKAKTTLKVSTTVKIKSENVSFDDMKIDGSAVPNGIAKINPYSSVVYVGADNVSFTNIDFFDGPDNTYDSNVQVTTWGKNLKFTGCDFSGAFRGIHYADGICDTVIDNCTFTPGAYPINVNTQKPKTGSVGSIIVKNSTLKGWTSWGDALALMSFENSVFESGAYNNIVAYNDVIFKNCDFKGTGIYAGNTNNFKWTIDNCKMNGQILKSGKNFFAQDDADYKFQDAEFIYNSNAKVIESVKTTGAEVTLNDLERHDNIDLNEDATYKVIVSSAPAEDVKAANDKIKAAADENREKQIFDISVFRTDSEGVQKDISGTINEQPVTVTLSETPSNGVRIYHVGETATEEITPVTVNGNDVSFTAPSFSTYAVTYNTGAVDETTITNKVGIVFSPVTEGGNEYYITLKALEAGKKINRFMAADIAFKNEGADVTYEIAPAANINVNETSENKYHFEMNGSSASSVSGDSITIGTVKFGGYGSTVFGIDEAATADYAVNIVNTAKSADNIIDHYDLAGGTLIVNDAANNGDYPVIADDETGKIDTNIKAETAVLTVNVEFNNPVGNQIATYQDMKVTVSGGDLTAEKVFAIGSDENEAANGQASITCDELTKNVAYTVTVTGAGYRTARHTVTMNGDKTLTFWNNVLDTAKSVEEGKTAVTKNFLAGDIVKDNKINIYDLSAVVSYYGRTNDTAAADVYAKYDLNRDGVIDSKDVSMVLVSWGE